MVQRNAFRAADCGCSLLPPACDLLYTQSMCNNLEMDSQKYTCCNGVINEGFNMSCCGTTSYNSLRASCCQDAVTNDLSQHVSECCGNKAYNPLNQICCSESILNRNSSRSVCCGSVVFDEGTQLCCGLDRAIYNKKENDLCCGNKTYDTTTHCCTPDIVIEERLKCIKEGLLHKISEPSQDQNSPCQLDTAKVPKAHHCKAPKSDSICCAGNTLLKKSGLTQCCGDKAYQLFVENKLCCDGILHYNQSVDAKCIGSSTFSPRNYTVCQNHGYPRPGRQCCGKNIFDPQEEICCNGHSHKKYLNKTSCCGSHTYDPKHQKCCSGQVHVLTPNSTDVECCGTLLLTHRTTHQCCRSADKSLIYKKLPNHHCCGHLYYDSLLWRCCSEQLIPFNGSNGTIQEKSLRPLTDFDTSDICTGEVLLGTLQSEVVKEESRVLVLNNVLLIQSNNIMSTITSFEIKLHDHCLFPPLMLGHTYLWSNNSKYEPLSDVTDLASSLHYYFTKCSRKF